MHVLLLGGGLQGLSVADSLIKDGYVLSVISDDETVLKSRLFKHKYLSSKNDLQYLHKVLSENIIDVIIPMGDKNAAFLSEHKEQIERKFSTKCAVPNYDLFSLVYNKSSFMAFCEENNIPHPKTIKLTSENLTACANEIGFPSLIKPDYSVGARGITKVYSKKELYEQFNIIQQNHGQCSLQEFIDNKDYYFNVMLYRTSEGCFVNYTIFKVLRMYPLGAGSSSCCVTIENNQLLQICKDTLNKLNWVGFADFDVLFNKETLEYKVIEINPRVPASLKAAAISNVNFPAIILADEMNQDIPYYEYKPGKTLRYLGIDILWFLKSKNRFKANPSWFSFFSKKTFYQDIYKNDASTWLTWFTVGLKKFFSS